MPSPVAPAGKPGTGAKAAAKPVFPLAPGAGPAPTTLSPEAAVELVRSLPIGLVVVGFVLFVVGLSITGAGFLALIGVLMLIQAVRSVIKAARERAASPAQQVAALLSAHVQSKSPHK